MVLCGIWRPVCTPRGLTGVDPAVDPWVDSRLGWGESTHGLRRAPPTLCHTEPGGSATGVTVRVLIVDDQAIFRRAAARMLARLPDFEVVGEAASGEASIEATPLLRPDLVLMDVHMPGIGGPEAARLRR